MTNVLVHYAAGVALAALVGSGPRAQWAWGLVALAPDIDGITALLLEPALHARAWTPAQAQGIAFVLAHRGLLHTVGFALAATLMTWGIAGRRGALLTAGLLASHLGLDALSTWPLEPLWPLTSANIHVGLLRVDDPAETVAAGLALVALVVGTRRRPSPLTPPTMTFLATALLLAPYAGSALAAAGAGEHARGTPTILHFPAYQFVEREGASYHVRLASAGRTISETDVPLFDVAPDVTPQERRALVRAQCELDHLGPLRWLDAPTFRIAPATDGWSVTATEARARQDPGSAPASLVFTVTTEGVTRVRALAGGLVAHGERDLDLPGAVATHAACAR